MKKIKIIIICGILSLGLIACETKELNQVNNDIFDEIDENMKLVDEDESVSEEELSEEEKSNLEDTESNDEATAEKEVVEEVLEAELYIQGPVMLRGATFYPPLTKHQAEEQGIEYDGLWEVNGVEFTTYDWVVGDDLMDEEEVVLDSDMTVDSYAEALGGHAATEVEMNYLLASEPVLDLEYGFGWPTRYWLGEWWEDKDGEGDTNPLFYDMEEYLEGTPVGYDFSPLNLPVIVVVGEMYEAHFTGVMEMREKEIAEDGTGYFVNMLWDNEKDMEEVMTIYLDENTLIFDEYGNLTDARSLESSQLGIDIVMNETGEYAAKIYILPFSMW